MGETDAVRSPLDSSVDLFRKLDIRTDVNGISVDCLPRESNLLDKLFVVILRDLGLFAILGETSLVRIDNDNAVIAIKAHLLALANFLDDVLHTHDGRNTQSTSHDGGVGRSTSNFDRKPFDLGCIKRRGFGRREVVSHDDSLFSEIVKSGRRLSQQYFEQLTFDVANVLSALRNVTRVHFSKTTQIGADHAGHGCFGRKEPGTNALDDFVTKRGITSHVAVTLENLSRDLQILSELLDVLIEPRTDVLNRVVITSDFRVHLILRDGPVWRSLTEDERRRDRYARRYGNPSQCFHLVFGHASQRPVSGYGEPQDASPLGTASSREKCSQYALIFVELTLNELDHCLHGSFGVLPADADLDGLSVLGAKGKNAEHALGVHLLSPLLPSDGNARIVTLRHLGESRRGSSVKPVLVGDF